MIDIWQELGRAGDPGRPSAEVLSRADRERAKPG